VAADATLASAIEVLGRSGRPGLPVVDGHNGVVGWLTQRDVLTACTARASAVCPSAAGRKARRAVPRAPDTPAPDHHTTAL
jgi:CBS domain-containing protein